MGRGVTLVPTVTRLNSVGPVSPVGQVPPVGPVPPVGQVPPVGPVGPVGSVNGGIAGKVGPSKSGLIEAEDKKSSIIFSPLKNSYY
ncbi:hypothetical protein [Bacillus wiedmannii]|uniref:hypothetical protein n=1 Tax=Bacillus wiedmannii TaxID=1890302 RepID=UPI00211D7AAE|nr:hypothetical protein [Bacillus wiedmannii]